MYTTNVTTKVKDEVCGVIYKFFSQLVNDTETIDIFSATGTLGELQKNICEKLNFLKNQFAQRTIDEPYEPSRFRYVITTPEISSLLLINETEKIENLYGIFDERGSLNGYPVYTYALLPVGCLMVLEDTEDGNFNIKKYEIKLY
jgi:hypothetical protein